MLEELKNCKPIKDAEGYYISPQGRVFKIQEMHQYNNGNGYMYTSLSVNGSVEKRAVHREVAKAFIPNPNNLSDVDHIDSNRSHNNLENLQWMSRGDNTRKAFKKKYVFEHEDGSVCVVFSLREFAREKDLDCSALSKLLRGKIKVHKKWRVI